MATFFSFKDKSGAIREAGGSFGKKEKAQEDQYFRQMVRWSTPNRAHFTIQARPIHCGKGGSDLV